MVSANTEWVGPIESEDMASSFAHYSQHEDFVLDSSRIAVHTSFTASTFSKLYNQKQQNAP